MSLTISSVGAVIVVGAVDMAGRIYTRAVCILGPSALFHAFSAFLTCKRASPCSLQSLNLHLLPFLESKQTKASLAGPLFYSWMIVINSQRRIDGPSASAVWGLTLVPP